MRDYSEIDLLHDNPCEVYDKAYDRGMLDALEAHRYIAKNWFDFDGSEMASSVNTRLAFYAFEKMTPKKAIQIIKENKFVVQSSYQTQREWEAVKMNEYSKEFIEYFVEEMICRFGKEDVSLVINNYIGGEK